MKKYLILLLFCACAKEKYTSPEPIPVPVINSPYTHLPRDPFLASSEPQKRNVVLEEFSGVYCPVTPYGHTFSKAVVDAHPGKVIRMDIHAGFWAGLNQNGPYPNYRTPAGEQLFGQTAIPSARVNRIAAKDLGASPWPGSTYDMDRAYWATATNNALKLDAPLNMDVRAIYNEKTRELKVEVEVYYTSTVSLSGQVLHVFLLQDDLVGKQKGGTGDIPDYRQMDVLRDKISSNILGDPVSGPSTKGSRFVHTYYYQVPEYINGNTVFGGGAMVIEDLKVLAFVAEGFGNIQNAAISPVE